MSAIEVGEILSASNSAGGVEVFHQIYNASGKEIKYITFLYEPYNAVGDKVACTIKKTSAVSCKLTGPIAPKADTYVSWKNVWYNPTISEAKIVWMNIEYTDGTEETIAGENILTVNDPESNLGKMRQAERETKAKKECCNKMAC